MEVAGAGHCLLEITEKGGEQIWRLSDGVPGMSSGKWKERSWWRVPTEEMVWTPAVEMYEKDDKFVVRAELPGMKKEEFDISVLGDTLPIKGERKAKSEVKDEDYYRCELCYGKFSRSVALPAAVDAKKVEASYENGILEITLPKVEEAKPKKVEVKVK